MTAEEPAEAIPAGTQVRVWWEATAAPNEEYGAAFYPAKVVRNITGTADDDDAAFVLEFATGECTVSAESVFPFDNPVAFGGEQEDIQVASSRGVTQAGELVELSNDNAENPLAWLVRVIEAGTDSVEVEFPFDFRTAQHVPVSRVRRSRFYESATKAWSLFQPYQAWDHGQITAPIELEFIFEKDYFQYLTEHAAEYMAALVLLEHSHSDAAALDNLKTQTIPTPVVPAPLEQPEQRQLPTTQQQQGNGKKGAKGRGRGVSTGGGRAKRRRTATTSTIDTDVFDVIPHIAPRQDYDGHAGVLDPTVPQVPDLPVVAAPPAEKAYNLLSRAFVPPPEGSLEFPPIPAPSSATPATQPTAAPTQAATAAYAGQGVQLRRSSRAPRPTAAAAALAGENNTAQRAAVAPQQPPQTTVAPVTVVPAHTETGPAAGGGMERVLMWVRPMMHRSGDHMMFEMAPAQPLPPGSWAQLLNPGSWNGIPSTVAAGAASIPASTLQVPLAVPPLAAAQALPPSSSVPTPSVPVATAPAAAPPLTVPMAAPAPPGRPPKQSKAFPKRALNPYLVFLRKHEPLVRAAQPELNNTQVTRHLATMWRNVSAEEREECKAVAEEDKMRYQGEVQAWARAHPDLAQGLHKPKLPTKRGMNGYVLFMKDFQARTLLRKSASGEAEGDLSNTPEQQLLNENGQDLNAAISAAWKALPENLRTEYKQRAQALKVGSAPPSDAGGVHATGAAPNSHGGKHMHRTLHDNTVPAPTAAVNIAANIGCIDSSGLGVGSGVDVRQGGAVHAVAQDLVTGLGAAPLATQNNSHEALHTQPQPVTGANTQLHAKEAQPLGGIVASEPGVIGQVLIGEENVAVSEQSPQHNGLGVAGVVNDAEGGEVSADQHVYMVPAPDADTELQK